MKEPKKAYLQCRAADDIPLALMWKRKIPEKINASAEFTVKVCDDLADGLIKLHGAFADSRNRISLTVPPTDPFDLFQGCKVFYEIAGPMLDHNAGNSYRHESYESMGELISICGLYAKCVVRLYNYRIYAEHEIPLDETRDVISFAETLNDPVIRNKYGIFCITEDISQGWEKASQVILYFDASHLIDTRINKVEE